MNKSGLNKILGILGLIAIIIILYFWLIPDLNWQGHKVPTGETETIQLPDGSSAHLIGPAQIGYPKNFDEKVRAVKMDGEIYFDIVRDNKKNFLVQTEKGGFETKEAKVLLNTKEKKNIRAHCFSDTIRMIAKGKKQILEVYLGPNEVSSFTKGDGELTKQSFDSIKIDGIN